MMTDVITKDVEDLTFDTSTKSNNVNNVVHPSIHLNHICSLQKQKSYV